MNVMMRRNEIVAGAILVIVIAIAVIPARAADAVTDFVKKELGVDLGRYAFGTPEKDFPELLPANPTETEWRRAEIQKPSAGSTTKQTFVDLRFEKDRLVAIRAMVSEFSNGKPTWETHRVLSEFKKLGAKPLKSNYNRFVLESAANTTTVEGFCSAANPVFLQLHITPPPQKRGSP
jgi:hypothetical protein